MAKFCGNCGAQMQDEAKICGRCGKPLASPIRTNTQFSPRPTTPPTIGGMQKRSGIQVVNKDEDNLVIINLGEALLFVLLGILNFIKLLKVDTIFGSGTISLKELLSDDDFNDKNYEAIPIIMGILIFIAAALSIVQLFSAPKKELLISQVIISVLAFVLLVTVYAIATNSDGADYYDLSLTFGGWLYLLVSLANILLSVLILKKANLITIKLLK